MLVIVVCQDKVMVVCQDDFIYKYGKARLFENLSACKLEIWPPY